ncbi:YrzI family small protein [Bacillus salacetis]|uniref:YrzI family small protein n=1 Tax=Bacillus salacetis TaxID=2315464 RepID=A0A3A1R8E6_9BACI|nr:YrzI family small protein [Bacillus salacetis]
MPAAGRCLFAAFFHGMKPNLQGGVNMTLNILFMSVTVKKRNRTVDEYNHELMVTKQFEENKLKQQTISMF